MATLTIDRLKKSTKERRLTSCSFEYEGETWAFWVRRLSESERCVLEARLYQDGKPIADYQRRLRVESIASMVANEDGSLMFDSSEGREALLEADAGFTGRLWDLVTQYSGMYSEDSGNSLKKKSADSSEASG